MHTKARLVLFLAACTLASFAKASDYRYVAFDVPPQLGTGTSVYGINDLGMLVGNYGNADFQAVGFLSSFGRTQSITVPGANLDDLGTMLDINERGEGVGTFTDPNSGNGRSYYRGPFGRFTILPEATPGAFLTEASGINNKGVIVGFVIDADFVFHGFIFTNGHYTIYDHPGSDRTLIRKINDRGMICGQRLDSDGHRRGFILFNGNLTDIDVPGSLNTRVGGINNLGQVVGDYDDASGNVHGYLYSRGRYTTLDFPAAVDTVLTDLNDFGVIVGTYDDYSHGLIAIPRH